MNPPRFEAYQTQVNIPLFNAAVHLAISTTDASKQLPALNARLQSAIWYEPADAQDYFEPYGIRYFGELLERYAEKVGDALPNLRAVALALAWTDPVLTNAMFVGSQRNDFMRTVLARRDDVYLAGALYIMATGSAEREERRERLLQRNYKQTEEILFALSALDDCREEAFSKLRQQLAGLLGAGRTIPVEGNTGLLGWFLAKYRAEILSCRKKDNAVLRALIRLTDAYVRPNDRAYDILREEGYLPMDILYVNSMFVWESRLGQNRLASGSIPAERLATAYVAACLNGDALPSEGNLNYIRWLLNHYRNFNIRYEGNSGLWEAVKPQLFIQCPAIMMWMVQSDLDYDYCFDVLDEKWDVLANCLPSEKYHALFRRQLLLQSEREIILSMLERYRRLTGSDYVSAFDAYDYYELDVFSRMVSQDILDPWEFFETHRDNCSQNDRSSSLGYLWGSMSGVLTQQAFRFWHKFFEAYTPTDVPRFWPGCKFHDSFIRFCSYTPSLDLMRSKLSREDNRTLYEWIDQSVFMLAPNKYSTFVLMLLQSEAGRTLFDIEELRPVFDQLLLLDGETSALCNLKHRYLTETELEEDRAAKVRAEQERKKAEAERLFQEVADTLSQKYDGSFQSLYTAFESFRTWDQRRQYAAQILCDRLPTLLREHEPITTGDFGYLLNLCGRLVGYGLLDASEAMSFLSAARIMDAEEVKTHADT